MLRRFLPKQDNFFELFQQAADTLVDSAKEFCNLLKNLDNQQHYVDLIATLEETGDKIAHHNFELLHKTFITPFDRDDIHQLTSRLDDIIDIINRIAQRFPFYHLTTIPEEMITLAGLSLEAIMHIKQATYSLHSLKNSSVILKHCHDVDAVESRAHTVVLAGEKRLFAEEHDFKQFFKLKEIYSNTKLVINRCQDVANILKGIVLEYS